MARSPFYRFVRNLLRKAHAANRLGTGVNASPTEAPSRRDVFFGALGVAALAPLVAACGDNTAGSDADLRIAIIGGGVAGLTASHFLRLAGVRAEVYEASERLGGRMYTNRDAYEASGQIFEMGGELVDTDHLVVQALCHSFGLQLDDLVVATDGLAQDTFVFDNGAFPSPNASTVVPEAVLVTAFTPIAMKMAAANAAGAGEDDASAAEFARIDAMSIPQWLNDEAGLAPTTLIRRILEIAYLEEFGLEVEEQSAWNLLTLIDYEEPEPFRIFGGSDERFHIHRGSDSLPLAMAMQLTDRTHLSHALTKVETSGTAYRLTFSTPAGDVTVTAAHVVYALPFTKLREVDLDGAGLSDDKRTVIDELGYGTNAKLVMQFSDRHWESAPFLSAGSVITDIGNAPDVSARGAGLQTIWSTSRGQTGREGILTNFVGGERGIAMGSGTPESQATLVLPWLEQVFPGIAAKYLSNSAVRMHWPSYEFTKGSYASYKVGQWAFFGTEGTREGNQHFCGEHCSEDYQGYMEGGAETGAMVAAEILDDVAIAQPAVLASILAMLTERRPRASYHAGFGKTMCIAQRKKRVLPTTR